MKNSAIFAAATLAAIQVSPQLALGHENSTASSHAPLGVMGDHLHKKGEFMFSYRYMRMDMDGSRIGTRRVSARETVGTMANPGQFVVAPTRMPMDMHMLGGMYGLTDNITLMGMTSYISNSMDHLWKAGISLPTGSTDERDDTPAMQNAFLPYPMQLGSGTYDLLPAITYAGRNHTLSWGAQANAVIRTGDNDEGYTLGDKLGATAWLAKDFNDSLSLSVRLNYQDTDNIGGFNSALNPRMIQTANTTLQAGDRTDLSLGVNYLFKNGHRLAVEYGEAIQQDLSGPQLEVSSVLTIGWQKAF